MEYTLSDEQRTIGRNIVKTGCQRDSATGLYFLFNHGAGSIEELQAWFIDLCEAKRKSPLTLFSDLQREQEVNAQVEQYERRQSLTYGYIKPKAADSYQHLKDLGKRMAWKGENE